MFTYNELLNKNSDRLWKLATRDSRYNHNGKCLITKEDEDFSHDEWDEIYCEQNLKNNI